jgi:ketosteroid isomerase-like protein
MSPDCESNVDHFLELSYERRHEMRTSKLFFVTALVIGVICIFVVPADSQTWSQEQLEVWKVIQDQWEAAKAKDTSWPERFLHPSFLGWSNENPTPRDKSSTKRWEAYNSANSKTIEQELSPLSIVVVGSTAVAHYYFSTATENYKGERQTSHGRYTDILVKVGDGWQFIAWHGGEE